MSTKNSAKFHFKQKKGKFIWKNCNFKLVFSKSRIQAFDDYAHIDSVNCIMYFYYNVSIYKKITEYNEELDKNEKKWKKVSTVSTYDFPTIEQLQFMLNEMLNKEIKLEDCRKITYYTQDKNHNPIPSGRYGYEYSLESEGFDSDDYYQITRLLICDENNKNNIETFSIYVGASLGTMPFASAGIKYPRLDREDLQALYDCVNGFIKYAIDLHNEKNLKYISNEIDSLKVKNNTLIKYDTENKDVIESLYLVNDNCDIITIENFNTDKMYSVKYNDTKITKITNEYMSVLGGYIEDNCDYKRIENEIDIPYSKIINIFVDVDKEDTKHKLYFNEKEIFEDFLSILDDDMKNEFANNDINFLFDKWKSAIMDRTWMCRNEHNFPKYVEDKGNHENVYYIIKKIVKQLKEEFNN